MNEGESPIYPTIFINFVLDTPSKLLLKFVFHFSSSFIVFFFFVNNSFFVYIVGKKKFYTCIYSALFYLFSWSFTFLFMTGNTAIQFTVFLFNQMSVNGFK